MQSFFRLPWSTDTGGDKLVLDAVVHQKAPKPKPVVDMALLNKQKRKRTASVDASPRSSHQPKKLKAAIGGAVQPPLLPVRGPDAHILQPKPDAPVQVNGYKPKPVADVTPSDVVAPSVVAPEAVAHQATAQTTSRASGNSETATPDIASESNANASTTDAPQASSNEPTSVPVFEPVDMADSNNVDRMRSVIDAQLNLEILLKHNELRLIEQELAKCQVALEQLRRCELIPYPGLEEASVDVAGGVGPALETPAGFTSPRLPAPWGVVDGPYARHYAEWLIKDPLFDPTVAQPTPAEWTASNYFSRSTRKSGDTVFSPLTGMRPARSSAGSKGQMLPHDPSRPYRDPLVIKRQQDGKWVKLYCTKCKPERSDFNNVQGFLNHCRISHKDGYESHEAAAIACGRPVEVNESFMMDPPPPRNRSSLANLEQTANKTPTVSTPVPAPVFQSASGSAHYLNKVPVPKHDPAALRQNIVPRKFDPHTQAQPISTPEGPPQATSPFVPSLQTPNLSALLQKRGITGDLAQAVTTAKRKADLSIYDCSDSESHSEDPAAKKAKASSAAPTKSRGSGAARGPPPASTPLAGRARAPSRLPAPLKGYAARALAGAPFDADADADADADLSPGSTTLADSNPGLVSDREDDDDFVDEDDAGCDEGERGGLVVIEDGSDAEGRGIVRKRLGGRGAAAEGVVVEGVCARARIGEGSGRMG